MTFGGASLGFSKGGGGGEDSHCVTSRVPQVPPSWLRPCFGGEGGGGVRLPSPSPTFLE